MKKLRIVERTFILFFILLFVCNTMSVASITLEPKFLFGDWKVKDGTELSFYRDHTYTMIWAGAGKEKGTWSTGIPLENTFTISFDGDGILSKMEQSYGYLVGSNYHFEVLKCNNDNFYLVQVYGDYTAYTSPCKLGFTREGAKEEFIIPPDPNSKDTGEDDNFFEEKSVPVELEMDNGTSTIRINWSWKYFLGDATEYNHNLAMAGLAISQMIHRTDSFEKKLTEYFGFEDIIYSPSTTPGYAFAHKLLNVNNQKKHVILVAIRGTNLGLSPIDALADLNALMDGFRGSTNIVDAMLEAYIRYIGCKKSDTILFITGHSLGGAVAQSLAPYSLDYVFNNTYSYIYTFASPNVFRDYFQFDSFDNVHNIVNEADWVVNYPFYYHKYGHIWYYDSGDKDKYQKYFNKLYKKENPGIDAHQPETYFAMMICELPRNMGDGANNPYSLTSVECPVDVTVKDMSGNVMGKTVGSTVHLENNSKVYITIEGESKKILAPPGVKYAVEIVGTGKGTMDIKHQLVNPVTGQAIESKEYNDIPVQKGKEFKLDIDGRVADELKLETSSKTFFNSLTEEDSLLVIILVSALVILIIEIFLLMYIVKRKRN